MIKAVLLPQGAVPAVSTNHADHLMELLDSKDWPFPLVGSAVLLAYRGRSVAYSAGISSKVSAHPELSL